MKAYAIALTLLFAIASTRVVKNATITQSKIREVVVPRNIVMPLSAYQPNCPLRLESVQIKRDIQGGTAYPIIRLRNVSNKPIKAYKVAYVIPGGNEGGWGSKGENILPGELIPEKEIPVTDGDLIPTDDTKKALKLEGPMQAIWVFMVVRIEFVDGSVYEDEKTHSALDDYFEKMRI